MNLRNAGLLVIMSCVVAAPARATVNDLLIFGDSLSDVGNVGSTFFGQFAIPPENFGDRFTNGFTWVEVLAGNLGLPLDGFSRDGGDNYAHGGATTQDGTASLGVIRNLGRQLDDYLPATPTPDSLHVMWIGANDYFDGQTNTAVPVTNLTADLNTLIANGATQLLVPNLPPLGQVPDFKGTADEAVQDALAASHNALLAAELAALDDDPALAVYRIDVFGLFTELLADPGAFGFTNTTDQAINSGPGGGVVADPDAYLFWDGKHPTGAAHALLGDIAFDAVANPTPGDTNLDGALADDDIDLMYDAIDLGVTHERFNLDGAGTVDAADATALIETVFATAFGDANLDRKVTLLDLNTLGAKFGQPGGWADGDFNGDDTVTLLDLNIIGANFGFDGATAPAVPEPSALTLLLVGALALHRRP